VKDRAHKKPGSNQYRSRSGTPPGTLHAPIKTLTELYAAPSAVQDSPATASVTFFTSTHCSPQIPILFKPSKSPQTNLIGYMEACGYALQIIQQHPDTQWTPATLNKEYANNGLNDNIKYPQIRAASNLNALAEAGFLKRTYLSGEDCIYQLVSPEEWQQQALDHHLLGPPIIQILQHQPHTLYDKLIQYGYIRPPAQQVKPLVDRTCSILQRMGFIHHNKTAYELTTTATP